MSSTIVFFSALKDERNLKPLEKVQSTAVQINKILKFYKKN